jgi:hypothetical protein
MDTNDLIMEQNAELKKTIEDMESIMRAKDILIQGLQNEIIMPEREIETVKPKMSFTEYYLHDEGYAFDYIRLMGDSDKIDFKNVNFNYEKPIYYNFTVGTKYDLDFEDIDNLYLMDTEDNIDFHKDNKGITALKPMTDICMPIEESFDIEDACENRFTSIDINVKTIVLNIR